MTAAAAPHALQFDPDYALLKQHVIDSTGLAYYKDKDNDLAARIGARLGQLTLHGCGAYLDLLKKSEAERHRLIGQLTIGETYFFRHSEQLDAVRDVALPDILERNRDRRTLRIWSAGCATGAEPYSLAIMLKQHFGDRLAGWDVRILGTDINQTFLARAERGEFDERAFRSAGDDLIKRAWFSSSGRTWTIHPRAKEWVSFQYHNLVEHPYPSIVHGIVALDLILCRNVMIYFDWPVIAYILGRFHDCLVDGGWLAVGHAESNPEIFQQYRTVQLPAATLYQKTKDPRPSQIPSITPTTSWTPGPAAQLPWEPPVLPAVRLKPDTTVAGAPEPGTNLEPGTRNLELRTVRRLADEGRWPDAAAECARLIAREQLNPVAHFYQALILEQMRNLTDAEGALRRVLYLDRAFVLAHYHLALLLAKTGRREHAVQSLRNVRDLLARMTGDETVPDADGLTADDLLRLADTHLELWQE